MSPVVLTEHVSMVVAFYSCIREAAGLFDFPTVFLRGFPHFLSANAEQYLENYYVSFQILAHLFVTIIS
jgi:hypothetical protein